MKVLNQLHNPTIVSQLSRIYPVQSLASTGFYRAYNSYPSSTIICNPNQIFLNSFAQYNPSPSINYSLLPITNSIPANYYSCQSLPINYSVPSLSYPRRYNTISSIGYSSLPTRITYYSPTYQSLNPPIPPIFYAPQSSNLSYKFVSSNFNVSSYRSNQVAVDSNPPIQFTDHFLMPIKNAQGSYDKLDLKQIAHLVPIGFTGGILEPEIDANNKLKICNSVSLSEIQSKIWIRNGDNLVELPNHLLEKNPQISDKNLHSSPMITPQISEQNLHSSPMVTPQTATSENSFLGEDSMPFQKMMSAFSKLNQSLIKVKKLTNLEREILTDATSIHSNYEDSILPSISPSTTTLSNSALLSSPSSSPSPPPTTINSKFEIMTLINGEMVNGDLERYELGSKFIVRLTGKPELSGRAILC